MSTNINIHRVKEIKKTIGHHKNLNNEMKAFTTISLSVYTDDEEVNELQFYVPFGESLESLITETKIKEYD